MGNIFAQNLIYFILPDIKNLMNCSTNLSNKPIKVLQLGSPAGLYGAERWILALIKHLNPLKITSIVGVIKDEPGQDPPLCAEAEKSGFETYCFEANGRFNLSIIRTLRLFIIQGKIDIIHTHFYKTDIVGFLATRGTGCRIISTPHGWTQNPDFKLRFYELFDRLIFSFLDAVVPLSEKMHQPLKKNILLKNKLHLIRNSVDLIEVVSEKNIAEELIGWKNEQKYIIGYIGRLVVGKGLEVLLHALAVLTDVDWKLAIIGEGDQKRSLRNLAEKLKISDKIIFFGFRPDRISFLKGFDVFVLPSRSEGTPRCVMEAMAARVPVIASDIQGCRNLIMDNQTGLLFPVDSSEKLADRIRLLSIDKDLCKKLVDDGFKYISDHFSAQRMANEYETLFDEMLKGDNQT